MSITTTESSAVSVPAVEPELEELRLAALLRQAPLEFARVVYGLNDRANGRAGTMAAEEVARTVRQGVPVTRERAEQRARAYLPVAGHEHCPRCWVFNGIKSPLHYRETTDARPESATCKACGAEYASALD
jgi:phage FluMu protein Com